MVQYASDWGTGMVYVLERARRSGKCECSIYIEPSRRGRDTVLHNEKQASYLITFGEAQKALTSSMLSKTHDDTDMNTATLMI